MTARVGADPALFQYSTSHRIEHIGDGLLHKDLSPAALIGDARDNRLEFLHDPRREPAVYRRLLGPSGIGPRCVGSGEDWIVVERIDGQPLWQIGEGDTWVTVARWLAQLHDRLADAETSGLPLVRHDATLAMRWRRRARDRGAPDSVLAAHERACARLLELPPTLIHGDLYASNVLVGAAPSPPTGRFDSIDDVGVWPVDWELAGVGPGVLDVAALTAGWPDDSPVRAAMESAYLGATAVGQSSPPLCLNDVAAARLYLCVQWLGSPAVWTPPEQHRHDWLAEARALAESI